MAQIHRSDTSIYTEFMKMAATCYSFLLYKIEWFIEFFATNKIDNLACVITHDNLTIVDYHETH